MNGDCLTKADTVITKLRIAAHFLHSLTSMTFSQYGTFIDVENLQVDPFNRESIKMTIFSVMRANTTIQR